MRPLMINMVLLLATVFLVLGVIQLHEGQPGWALVDLVMCLVGLCLVSDARKNR